MSKPLKIGIYAALVLGAIWFGSGFYRNYATVMQAGNSSPALTPDAANAPTASSYPARKISQMVSYGLGIVVVLIGLGLMTAHDVTHFVANKMEALIFNDEGEGVKNPEYEHAEDVWRDGKPLEAIQLMRDYLQEHPREQYVALRIAEIYEQDLNNYLAAALEYEEILKRKLPPERWGWAAIHLANLYTGRLNKITEAEALLRRIVEEYGHTAAAKKARQRLGLPEPVEESNEPEPVAEEEKSEPPPPPPPPASNLPPGFRPKAG